MSHQEYVGIKFPLEFLIKLLCRRILHFPIPSTYPGHKMFISSRYIGIYCFSFHIFLNYFAFFFINFRATRLCTYLIRIKFVPYQRLQPKHWLLLRCTYILSFISKRVHKIYCIWVSEIHFP